MLSFNECIVQTKELLNLGNLDLQEGRTKESIELITGNIGNYKSQIFKSKELKELKELMKYV